jgi:hypothetical protein
MTFVILVFTVGLLSMVAVFGLCVAWMESRPRRRPTADDWYEQQPVPPSIAQFILWQAVLEAEDRAQLENDAARLIYELSVEGDVLLALERADRDKAA